MLNRKKNKMDTETKTLKCYPIKLYNGTDALILEDKKTMRLVSKDYNLICDKTNGCAVRFGETFEEDPDPMVGLPEIADIEISTICSGVEGIGICNHCYKSNNPNGKFMSFETFKKLFEKLPKTVKQIAFGIGDMNTNSIKEIFPFCVENGVTPNITINGSKLTKEYIDLLVNYCGGISVSLYDKEITYNAVEALIAKRNSLNKELPQVNIHIMFAQQTLHYAYYTLQDVKKDPRLNGLNAVVLLSLKKKGRAVNLYESVSKEDLDMLLKFVLIDELGQHRIGFDSCTVSKVISFCKENIKDEILLKQLIVQVEPCESSLFSMYVNTDGKFFPCSFIEGTPGWEEGLDVLSCNDFIKDIWWNERTIEFRKRVIDCRNSGRCCVYYDI